MATNVTPGASNIAKNIVLQAVFNEAMDEDSFTEHSVRLAGKTGGVHAAIAYDTATHTVTLIPFAPLDGLTSYTFTVGRSVTTLSGTPLGTDTTIAFTTEEEDGVDTDSDGVPDSQEEYPGDSSRTTVKTVTNTGAFTLDVSALRDGVELAGVKTYSENAPSLSTTGKPSDLVFRDGLLAYRVVNLNLGDTIDIPVRIPSGIPLGTRIFKVDETEGYTDITSQCRIYGNTVTLRLTDGGIGDADGSENGTIDDPVGVAMPLTAQPVPDNDSGGPCFIGSSTGETPGGIPLALGLLTGVILAGAALRKRHGVAVIVLLLACALPMKVGASEKGPFSLAVGLGAAAYGSETDITYQGQEQEFSINHALYPTLRLDYAVNSRLGLELAARYDWYRWDVTPSLTEGNDSDFSGVTVALGPVWRAATTKKLGTLDGHFFVAGAVTWRHLDADLDYSVRGYDSAPGLELAGGFLADDNWELRLGAGWSRHSPEGTAADAQGDADLTLFNVFFDVAYRFQL